jgi:alkanesulfonate monooxygenase SsuD/methylene tetrahydromethanopterin reductase-like flavin-dependent oxidoreductase (luciferase family)
MRIGLFLAYWPWFSPEEQVSLAELADELGLDSVWISEAWGQDAVSVLGLLAGRTRRVALGSGLMQIPARAPAATAMAAATLQDLSGGRFILGIGAGSGPKRVGGPGPLDLVRRYASLTRRILEGEEVDPDDALGTPRFRLDLPSRHTASPIWLAALGDHMVELAGAIGDGVLLNWCTPERVATARRLVTRGAERSGRNPANLAVAVYVRACLGVDQDVARAALEGMAAQYASLPHYRRQFEQMGLDARVPDQLVRATAVLGGRAEALARFGAYREAGADVVLCYPVVALDPYSSLLGTVLAAAPSPAVER